MADASSTPSTPHLSVVIPAYNEEERLPSTIREIEAFLASKPYSWELIVVDDGSRDRTVEIARQTFSRPESRVDCNPRNMGKGATVRRGMLLARGAFRLFTDADNSTPIQELDKLLARLESTGSDVAIGSRALRESQLEQRQPFYREFMGRTFNRIVQFLAVPGIRDTQCGFKLFTAPSAEHVFKRQRLEGFSFDVEVLMLARSGGFKIEEVPVRWINSPSSRVSPIKDSAKMFLDVVRIRFSKY
jgi:dolichyl-phosphate beta-glucosyltransferase